MSAEAAALTSSWQVGRYTVTLTAPRLRGGQVHAVSIEWAPHLPAHLTESEVAQYERGRNAAVAELAAELGGRAAVVDL